MLNAYWEMRDMGMHRQEESRGSGDEISGAESELTRGHSNRRSVETRRSRFRGRTAARLHAVVARDCALLPAEVARGRRARVSAGVLDGDRLGIRHLIPLRRGARASSTTGLLLSRRADHDRALHLDLHHDVGHRRPQGRISALGAGRPGAALGDCAGQGSGRHHARRDSGNDLSDLRAIRRRASRIRCKSCWSPWWSFWFRLR